MTGATKFHSIAQNCRSCIVEKRQGAESTFCKNINPLEYVFDIVFQLQCDIHVHSYSMPNIGLRLNKIKCMGSVEMFRLGFCRFESRNQMEDVE